MFLLFFFLLGGCKPACQLRLLCHMFIFQVSNFSCAFLLLLAQASPKFSM